MLTLSTEPVPSVTKKATFTSLTIAQSATGEMSMSGDYRIDLIDADGKALSMLEWARFQFTQAELMANPSFPTVYGVIRELARTGLAKTNPELVVNQ